MAITVIQQDVAVNVFDAASESPGNVLSFKMATGAAFVNAIVIGLTTKQLTLTYRGNSDSAGSTAKITPDDIVNGKYLIEGAIVDDQTYPGAESVVDAHNVDPDSHQDIRALIATGGAGVTLTAATVVYDPSQISDTPLTSTNVQTAIDETVERVNATDAILNDTDTGLTAINSQLVATNAALDGVRTIGLTEGNNLNAEIGAVTTIDYSALGGSPWTEGKTIVHDRYGTLGVIITEFFAPHDPDGAPPVEVETIAVGLYATDVTSSILDMQSGRLRILPFQSEFPGDSYGDANDLLVGTDGIVYRKGVAPGGVGLHVLNEAGADLGFPAYALNHAWVNMPSQGLPDMFPALAETVTPDEGSDFWYESGNNFVIYQQGGQFKLCPAKTGVATWGGIGGTLALSDDINAMIPDNDEHAWQSGDSFVPFQVLNEPAQSYNQWLPTNFRLVAPAPDDGNYVLTSSYGVVGWTAQ